MLSLRILILTGLSIIFLLRLLSILIALHRSYSY